MTDQTMTIHSKTAWDIASRYSAVLASETRDLAGAIDKAIADERERCAEIAEGWPATFDGMVSPQGRYAAENIAHALRNPT